MVYRAKGGTRHMKTLYHMATRGNLYSIALQQGADGVYCIREYKHGREVGCASLGNFTLQMDAIAEYNRRIDSSATYDSIFYVKAVR